MNKFAVKGSPAIENFKMEEFLYENTEFSIATNRSGEIRFNDTVMGIMNYRKPTNTGWEISISRLFVSGAITTDVIEVIKV